MKRTRRRILSAALAAAMLLCTVPKDAPLRLLEPPAAAHAEEGKVTLDEKTGVLTLSGEVTKEQVRAFEKGRYVTHIVAAEGTVLPEDCSEMFMHYHLFGPYDSALTEDSREIWSFVSLRSIDLSKADASHVTNMDRMFSQCANEDELFPFEWVQSMWDTPVSLNLSGLDTSKVTSMSGMFDGCSSLKTLDLSSFDTSNVTNMSGMFDGCSSFKTLDLSSFDTSNVTNMSGMFNGCAVSGLDLRSFDTSAVENMNSMFSGCTALRTITVSDKWSTQKVNSSKDMFKNCKRLKGGSGTVYNEAHTDAEYARLDNLPDEPGYLSEARILSGTCGEKLTWKFDTATGALTVEGTGAMTDFLNELPPWREFAAEIETLTLPEGLTNIGAQAFANLERLQSVTIPASVQNINAQAFLCRGLEDVYILNPDTVIRNDAVTFCNSVKTEQDENGENVIICEFTGTIHGNPNSGAQKYAQKYGRNFQFFPGNETEGACGDNLTWSYDTETQTLTIAGTGAMYDWARHENKKEGMHYQYMFEGWEKVLCYEYLEFSLSTAAPWEAYKDSIRNIVLPEGITSISPFSFCHCSNLETIVLPASLASLGGCAFYACSRLEDVVVLNPEMVFDPNPEEGWDVNWTISNVNRIEVTFEDTRSEVYGWYSKGSKRSPYPTYSKNIYGYADSTAHSFAAKYEEYPIWDAYYAKWKTPPKPLPTFKCLQCVSLDANGGTGEMNSIPLGYPEDQKTATLPECSFTAPEAGMVFAGWNVLGETKQPGEEITSEDGITVKALWEYSFYEIKFDANGGTGEQETLKVLVNTTFYLPACTFTAPEDLSFTGWQISGATDKTWQPGDPFLAEQDVTLIPVWAKTVCTVTFDANGGTGEMDAKTVAVNAEFTFPKCKFTAPEGKQFSAWMIGEDTYEIGDTVTITEDTVIKAVWTAAQEDPFVPTSDKKRGNLDGSGAIDTKDAMLLSRYVNGWEDALPDPEAADIDGDDDITVRDAMILTRYVNGWEGYGKYFDTES